MLVKDWMNKNVITLDVTDTMQHAINIVMENKISLMPVMEDGKLVGIVTDRDLKRASPSDSGSSRHATNPLSCCPTGSGRNHEPLSHNGAARPHDRRSSRDPDGK